MKIGLMKLPCDGLCRGLCAALLVLMLGMAGCGRSHPAVTEPDKKWLPSGQIVLSRPVPEVSSPRSLNMLGFIPIIGSPSGIWLSINLSSSELTLMEGSRVITSSKLEGGEGLSPGSYQVLHMQRSPLWYATDRYFEQRSLPVPPQGDRARFRRGALGEYAIFINKDTPIHCGPVWSEEVGGIRIPEPEMAKIYNQLQVGSVIEVK
ncbi:MAG: L,D-transpeptidase [Deltaproteobacteria bacterium]|nr:L,D-transpeptidase [Deltaproteobacteria bacterium]